MCIQIICITVPVSRTTRKNELVYELSYEVCSRIQFELGH